MKLGVVTGLKREAACLPVGSQPDGLLVLCSGADSDRAEQHARRLLDQGCRALVSFGLAGGLAEELSAGDLVIPATVVTSDGSSYAPASNWRTRLFEVLPKNGMVSDGKLFGSDALIPGAAEKSALHSTTGAVAVDMESHRVARVAAEAGVPFLCLRAISDDASAALPDWVAGTVDADGSTRYATVLARVLRNPKEIGRLIRLSRDSEAAFATLRRVAGLAGPLLRFA